MHKWLSSGSLRIEPDQQDEVEPLTTSNPATIQPSSGPDNSNGDPQSRVADPTQKSDVSGTAEQEVNDPLLASPRVPDNSDLAQKYNDSRDISNIEM